MKTLFAAILLLSLPAAAARSGLRAVLLEQLHDSHDVKSWYAPAKLAVEGLTPEQASWSPDGKSGSHSVGQLANHLLFWNARNLARFNGEKPEKYSGDNKETFDKFDAKTWPETVRRLDEVMTAWEKAVETCDEKKLAEWASTIAHIGAHNAYHIGQMVYVRKLQGTWDADKGVKG